MVWTPLITRTSYPVVQHCSAVPDSCPAGSAARELYPRRTRGELICPRGGLTDNMHASSGFLRREFRGGAREPFFGGEGSTPCGATCTSFETCPGDAPCRSSPVAGRCSRPLRPS